MLLKSLVLKQIERHYRDSQIQKIFQKNDITDIVISGYSSSGSLAFAINALYEHINVWVMINSWKDFYINDFIPFRPTGVFMWSESMKSNYMMMNTHIDQSSMMVSGNAVFDRFYNAQPSQARTYYESKYGLSTNQDILLYSMLDPERYAEEVDVINMIGEGLNKKMGKKAPIILVKKNPFDMTDKVDRYFRDNANIIVLEYFSERNKEADFFVQSSTGEREWIDFLYYSKVNIGAASTVALEAIMMHKPVITIAFDHFNQHSAYLQNMADAPFYKDLLLREDVEIAKNNEECISCIEKFLSRASSLDKIPNIIGNFDGLATQRMIGEIDNA